MSHTPEPWRFKQRGRAGLIDIFVGDDINGRVKRIGELITADNARRIVACVNACEGVPTVELEAENVEFIRMLNQRHELISQRDELLAAAKNLRDVKGRHHSEQAFKTLIDVIANVDGGIKNEKAA